MIPSCLSTVEDDLILGFLLFQNWKEWYSPIDRLERHWTSLVHSPRLCLGECTRNTHASLLRPRRNTTYFGGGFPCFSWCCGGEFPCLPLLKGNRTTAMLFLLLSFLFSCRGLLGFSVHNLICTVLIFRSVGSSAISTISKDWFGQYGGIGHVEPS